MRLGPLGQLSGWFLAALILWAGSLASFWCALTADEDRRPKLPARMSALPSGEGDQHGALRAAAPRRNRAVGWQVPAASAINFTLVSQASADRLWMLPWLCDRWAGPFSIALGLSAAEAEEATVVDSPPCSRMKLTVVIVAKIEEYPVNRLRNVAVAAARTSHLLILDIDMWPEAMLFQKLMRLAGQEKEKRYFAAPHNAFVVPAFDRGRWCESPEACEAAAKATPKTLRELVRCMAEKRCHVFDHGSGHGHNSTGYTDWVRQESLRRVPCFSSPRYEPYLVVPAGAATPRFDERFYGYGKNKIQWVAHLRLSGFSFWVLPRAFVVHCPHAVSPAKSAWQRGYQHAKMDVLYRKFLGELAAVASSGLSGPARKQERSGQAGIEGNGPEEAVATTALLVAVTEPVLRAAVVESASGKETGKPAIENGAVVKPVPLRFEDGIDGEWEITPFCEGVALGDLMLGEAGAAPRVSS